MKTTRSKTNLGRAITPEAKRAAESLGISVAQYIVNLATLRRMLGVADGESIHKWIADLALQSARRDRGGETISLRIPTKMAKRLKRAAEFEEVSVGEYLLDGLKRDLKLSEESMPAAK